MTAIYELSKQELMQGESGVAWNTAELAALVRAAEPPKEALLMRRVRMLATGTQSRPLKASTRPSICGARQKNVSQPEVTAS
jgi:hypothetical protein